MIGHVADWDLCAIKVRLCAANVAHRPKASGRRCAVIRIRCSTRCTRSPASSTPRACFPSHGKHSATRRGRAGHRPCVGEISPAGSDLPPLATVDFLSWVGDEARVGTLRQLDS
jgi:hypothetical protein